MRIRIAQALVIVLAIASLGAARRPISTGAMNYAPGPSKVAAAALSGQPKPFQVGPASWYGEDFHGRATASGEPYNMFDLTAAHLTLPLGTRVKVTNIRNGHSVIVRINDRGPVVPGRIIDLGYRGCGG